MHKECISSCCPDQAEAASRLDSGPNKGQVNELHCRVETSFDSLASFRSAWDEAVVRLGGSLYMSYDWCRVWWEFYGAGKELRVFIFSAAGVVVGILPLYIDSIGFRPARFRVARLVGANIPPKVFDPPIDEDWAGLMFEQILLGLFETDRCDLLSFGPVSELHKAAKQLAGASCRKAGLVMPAEEQADGVHSIFWLPSSLSDYFESLSKNERKNRRKYELRLLKKDYTVRVEVLSDSERVDQAFDEFVVQHTLYWQAQGKSGHFGAWPEATEFNRALVKAHGKLGRMRFIRILADEQVVANQYTFAFGDSYFWELPSRLVGGDWEKFSLGPTGIVTMIDEAIKEGKKRLEGGLAHYEYKVRLGAKEYAVTRVRAVANRATSRMRVKLYNALRICLLYAYHKIWYRRITPRLPAFFRKPQWMFWLRLDF